MALLNDIYVWVKDEQLSRESESTSHPVEQGIDITDHIKNSPIKLSISGKIVMCEGIPAYETLSKVIKLQREGSLITYIGRNYCGNMQIQSFNSTHPHTNWGGLDFNMELKEVKIAKSAYIQPIETSPSNETVSIPPSPVIEKGSMVIFKGGPVYVSSDANKPAAKRERSFCEVTQPISNYKHNVHCISKDGKMVYGWVDMENVEIAPGNTPLTGKTNGGTQQVLEILEIK